MASLGTTFDANTVAPAAPREILPPGDYLMQIVESGMQDTKTGGQMLVLTMDVLDGQHAGRKAWDRLNLVNNNAQAVEIANRTLSAICHATGQMTVSDSEQLHFKPMLVKIAVQPAGPDKSGTHREASNQVKGYSPAKGGAPRAAAPAAAAVAPKATGTTPPWRR